MVRNAVTTGCFVALVALVAQWPGAAGAQQFVTEEPDPVTYAEVTVDKLNVRAKPDQESEQVGQLNKGDLVPIKKVKDGWAQLAWSGKAYVAENLVSIPPGKVNRRPKYEQMREAFIAHARELDPTIVWLEVPRASGLTVRYHWREYRDKAELVKRCQELARLYSVMTTGETGIAVDIISGNELWARAFY
jgi:hypothetical protein